MDLPQDITNIIFSYLPISSKRQVIRTCKTLYKNPKMMIPIEKSFFKEICSSSIYLIRCRTQQLFDNNLHKYTTEFIYDNNLNIMPLRYFNEYNLALCANKYIYDDDLEAKKLINDNLLKNELISINYCNKYFYIFYYMIIIIHIFIRKN